MSAAPPTLEVLVGPVASGKSTYSDERAKTGAIIVNDDAIVTALHGGHYDFYQTSLKPLYKLIQTNAVLMGLTLRRDVVIDSTNLTRETRRRLVGLAHAVDAVAVAIMFPWQETSVHALRRTEDESRGYSFDEWCEIVERHRERFEDWSPAEGFDAVLDAYPILNRLAGREVFAA